MKNFYLILFLLVAPAAFAQGEANNWYFGNNAGIKFNADGTVSALAGGQMTTNEGCSSISDAQGNLLFYTDGRNVWDRNGLKMPNGNYNANTGLFGDPSSTQSGIIVPKKGDPNIYYIFTVDEPHHDNAAVYPNQFSGNYSDNGSTPTDDDGFNNGFNYSVVDLSVTGSNGSIGDIVTRNVPLVTYNPLDNDEKSYKCSEKITAVKTADGTGFWVITHFVDNFYAFKVDATGVNTTPVVTNIIPMVITSGYRRNSIGYMKSSPDGKKLAIAHNQLGSVPGQAITNGVVYLYDFNAGTGVVSNPVLISSSSNPYGIEFSREAKKLYVSYGNGGGGGGGLNGVVQYDLLSSFIESTAIQVSGSATASGALQLGPNGKIYRAVNGSLFLDVIEDPEADGVQCNYASEVQPIGGPSSRRTTLGLPPFITSLFSASIVATNNCLGQATTLELTVNSTFDSVVWDFGDGSATSTATMPVHTYATAGTFNVTATITKDSDVTVVSAPIIVSVIPVANNAPQITECDADNNGTETFDFTATAATIRGGQSAADYDVKFYKTQANADADADSLPVTTYVNTQPTETIFARIHNKANPNCYATTSFSITVSQSPPAGPQNVNTCDDAADGDDTNGKAITNLNAVTQQIVQGSTQFSVQYYETSADAAVPQNPLPAQFYNTTPNQQIIYARITNTTSPVCFGIVPVTINILLLPVVPPAVTLVQCDLGATPDGITQFNLTEADTQFTTGSAAFAVRYFASAAGAQNALGQLPDLYTNTANPQVVTARIENIGTGCYRLAQVTLQVNFSAVPVITLQECDNDSNGADGLTRFNLDDAALATGTNTVTYYATEADALAELNAIPAAYTNTTQNQVVFARIENNNACVAIHQIRLVVRRLPDIEITDEDVVCVNTAAYITLTAGLPGSTNGYSFLWSTLETSPTIEVNQPGVYTVTVTDLSNTAGCSRMRTITVTASDIARITEVQILDLRDNNIVTVFAGPNTSGIATTYLYSLDLPNGPYQAGNVFENVSAGFHTVYVYDEQLCGVTHKDITVLEIPKFFTPNGDGVNDTWNIIGVNALFYAKSNIYVYDRFGKLLADVDPRGPGWDGMFNGHRLPATDYWYVVQLDNGRTVKGHFSLLR
ncbi:MAG: T9SS type B sorting domain-containing protein [Flavobacterium sp.]